MQRPLWFKAKRYGYGWYPASWQGWFAMLVWLLFFAGAYVRWDVETQVGPFLADVSASTGALVWLSWYTGEKARWRWGK